VYCPVKAYRTAADVGDAFKPASTAFGKDDARNRHAIALTRKPGHDLFGVRQRELEERGVRKHAAPSIKYHYGLCASFYLGVEIVGDGSGVDGKDFVQQVRPLVEHFLDRREIRTATPFY